MTTPFLLNRCWLTDGRLGTASPKVFEDLYAIAGQVPAFDVDYTQRTITDRIGGITPTFTRPASEKRLWDGAQLRTYPADVPGFELRNGTWEYVHEPAATNSIRNNSMAGAVAGTPGTLPNNWATAGGTGLTREVVGTGVSQGVTYIDIRYSGTAATTFLDIYPEVPLVVAATNSQAWTTSVFIQLVGGTFNGVPTVSQSLQQLDSGGAVLSGLITGVVSDTVDATFKRISRTYTTNNASTAFVRPVAAQIGITNGAAIDFTIRIGWPQLELGPVATSPIVTTGSTVTRSADTLTVSGTPFASFYNQLGGTWYLDVATSDTAATSRGVMALEAAASSSTNLLQVFRQLDSQGVVQGLTAGVNQFTIGSGATWTTTQARKMAIRHSLNDVTFVTDGALHSTDTSASLATVDQMRVGTTSGGFNIGNMRFRRLAYWPPGPAQSRLQQLAT